MSIESTQVLINTARQYTNLEDYKNALTQALTALNVPAPSAGVASVTGEIVDDTDPANPIINATSGTWTPVISGVTNAADVSAVAGFYTNVNGVVSGWIKVSLELTDAVLTSTSFKFSLPVLPTANFADADKLIGAIGVQKITFANTVIVTSTTGDNTATVNFDATTPEQLNALSISFSYQV